MSNLAVGEIHFVSIPSDDEVTELSYFLLKKSIKNRIGVNVNNNLTIWARNKYPVSNYIDNDRYMPYEIVDTPWSGEFREISNNLYLELRDNKTYVISSVEESRLPDLQKFFEDIIVHEMISYITFELEDIHNGPNKFYECEITANQFCQAIIDASGRGSVIPSVKMMIVR